MKRIAYILVDNGIDGMGPDSITEAFWSEDQRDTFFNKDPNKSWRTKKEIVVDIKEIRNNAFAKLNGLDMLALNMDTEGNYSPANSLIAATKPT